MLARSNVAARITNNESLIDHIPRFLFKDIVQLCIETTTKKLLYSFLKYTLNYECVRDAV